MFANSLLIRFTSASLLLPANEQHATREINFKLITKMLKICWIYMTHHIAIDT